MNGNTLGARIRSSRESQNITQKKLAEMINMSQQNLLRIEKDEVNPSVVTLGNISKSLSVTPNELLGIWKYGQETPLSFNIRNLRNSFGYTPYEFGDRIGLSGKIVLEFETGESLPNRATFDKIISEFDVTEEELMKPIDNPNISTNGRKILNLLEKRNGIIENARAVAFSVDNIETTNYDESTDTYTTNVITAEEQAIDQLVNSMRLGKKTLDEVISVYEFVCDMEVKKLSQDI